MHTGGLFPAYVSGQKYCWGRFGMSDTPSAGSSRAPGGPGLAALPAIWVGVVVLLSAYGIYSAWPATYAYDLPDGVLYFIYAGMVVGLVNTLWGLHLLGLALGRSALFPRRFIVWQIVNI